MKYIFLIVVATFLLAGCSIINTQETPSEIKPNNVEANSNTSTKDKLDLSGQGLQQVSQSVFEQTNLRELNVSNNQLTGALPAEIRQLQKLEVLNAANNQMTGVPAEIGQLSKLVTLDLSNNQLTGLPYELGNLQKLKTLNLSGNQVSEQDLDGIRQNLSADVNIIK